MYIQINKNSASVDALFLIFKVQLRVLADMLSVKKKASIFTPE
jgi:hypothetical protein